MLTPSLALVSKYFKPFESVNSCICWSVTCLESTKSPLHPTRILQQPPDPLLILHDYKESVKTFILCMIENVGSYFSTINES